MRQKYQQITPVDYNLYDVLAFGLPVINCPCMPAGRPTDYDDAYPEQAGKLCQLGATDPDLADFFGVAISTVRLWMGTHAEFSAAIKDGKEAANARVERSLYQRAMGYTYDAVKIFQYEGVTIEHAYREHCPPDSAAMIFWLKNRKPEVWRDRREVTGADGGPLQVQVVKFTDDDDTQA